MQPAFEDETPVNPFDLWKGADFKLKITKVAGFWNYDKSEFDTASTLGGFSDKELEGVWKQEHSLAAYTADDQFKSYEELKERLDRTLKASYKPDPETVDEEVEIPTARRTTDEPVKVASGDDTLSYFAKLANED